MFKLELTHTKNLIVLILGVLMALGIGPLEPYMMLIYGVACVFIFFTRTRYYYLSVISTILTIILFVINFTFTNGVPGSFAAGSQYVTVSIGLALICVISYFVLNLLLLTGKIKPKSKENVTKKRP